ncbi:MAG TPA: D-alanine--D-alanine ligase [Phnomibacter sp.]|nr:D-alanine--D-alanine ligase [Phnomibacter sp.]
MRKAVIAFVTGGYSGEAEISYKSAITIKANLDTALFDYYTIDVRRDGWWYTDEQGKEWPINKADFSLPLPNQVVHFDAVLIGIHGTPGEDGKLQGYFDLIGMPYTSCNTATSAITFNKRYTVAVAAMAGISVARSFHYYNTDTINTDELAANLSFPVFVKPSNGGSSIGMSKVPDATGLPAAIAKAFAEDDQVLIEEFIEGREFTIGVCRLNGQIVTLPMTEVISQNYFFDFEAKYQGKSTEITPALLEEDKANLIREAAKKIYGIFNCNGVIRIDFIFNEQAGRPFMLEVNTVPGQSEASIVPQQVKAMGMHLKDFYTEIIMDCLSRYKVSLV